MESEEQKKAVKYAELETRLQTLLENKDEVNLEKRRYRRDFLALCRAIVQETGNPQCPLTEDELKTYRGRNKPQPIPRPSIERAAAMELQLNHAENAWKPERKVDSAPLDPNDLAARQLFKDVRGVLNKITPTSFAELCQDFLDLKVHTKKEHMSTVIDIIFDKAVEEPRFCPLYSDLCKQQVTLEIEQMASKSNFRRSLLIKCQQMFETKREDALKQMRSDAEAEQNVGEKKRTQLLADCQEAERKDRGRMLGNIVFIGQLYRNELLVPLIMLWCVVHLFQRHANTAGGDEESVECAVKLLETIGKIFDRDSKGEMATKTDLIYIHLQEIAEELSNRVRFSIESLIELREGGWVPRKSADQGPKTLQQIHQDAKEDERRNKMERAQWERAGGGGGGGRNAVVMRCTVSRAVASSAGNEWRPPSSMTAAANMNSSSCPSSNMAAAAAGAPMPTGGGDMRMQQQMRPTQQQQQPGSAAGFPVCTILQTPSPLQLAAAAQQQRFHQPQPTNQATFYQSPPLLKNNDQQQNAGTRKRRAGVRHRAFLERKKFEDVFVVVPTSADYALAAGMEDSRATSPSTSTRACTSPAPAVSPSISAEDEGSSSKKLRASPSPDDYTADVFSTPMFVFF